MKTQSVSEVILAEAGIQTSCNNFLASGKFGGMEIIKQAWVPIARLTAERWIAIGSTVIIPVVIALVGAFVSIAIQQSQNRVKYVEIAIGVLAKDPVPETVAIREWAIQVWAKYSPIHVDDKMKEALRKYPIFGEVVATLKQTLGDAKVKPEGTVRDAK